MLNWIKDKLPFSSKELTLSVLKNNTDRGRISRSKSQIKIVDVKYNLLIKELPLYKRVKNFLTKGNSLTLFLKMRVVTENTVSGKRYQSIIVLPYMKNMKSKKLSNLPVQVYSATPDFKFRFAYNLLQSNNLYLDEDSLKSLKVALTTKPTQVTPVDSHQLDKHLFYILDNIDKIKVDL